MPSEATWTPPTRVCPHPERWSAPDNWATETEVTAFLGALCVLLRPTVVVETGSYAGDTTVVLGERVASYGGHVHTVEADPQRAAQVVERCQGLPVTVHSMRSSQFTPPRPVDLAFLDSALDAREAELRMLAQHAAPGAVWALHDTRHLPGVVDRLAAQGVIREGVEFPTPRGLAVGRFA